ncbi:MAG TPA: ABC transporter permease [Thermomicrobiales bacterium]|nr:ABC transporter permease [Thermomicrobiales bacterium]
MTRYIIRRLLQMIPLLLGISFIVFALINLVPGSPLDRYENTPGVRRADLERISESLGLSDPWYQRYFSWLWNALQGDFGFSFTNFSPVSGLLADTVPNTLLLAGTSVAFALIVAVPLGVICAVKRGSAFDNIVTVITTALFSIPSLWLGLMLIIIFAVQFQRWDLPSLPVSGDRSLRGESGFVDRAKHLILPALTLSLVQLAGWTRYIRSEMLEVIRLDYVRTASAKGLRQQAVLIGHAFRNAVLPLITLVGLNIPDLFAGALIVENVFGWNGVGRLTISALSGNNYSVAMAAIMMLSFLTVIGNLIADILYAVFDPRVRFD